MAQSRFPAPFTLSPQFVLRSRKEYNTRDAVNARQFEHWQTDGKYSVNSRPDKNKRPVFHDVLPLNSRMNDKNYSAMPRYNPNETRGGGNSYFNKYDTTYDSRNTVRELRGTVYEDKNISYLAESRGMLTRAFDNRWLSSNDVKDLIDTIESRRLMSSRN
jgi:hypothetical protein